MADRLSLETIAFSKVAPGTSLVLASAVADDSMQMRSAAEGSKVAIMDRWGFHQASGEQDLIWNTAHDTTRPLTVPILAGELDTKLAQGIYPQLNPNEIISPYLSGSAVAGDVELGMLTVMYRNLSESRLSGIDFATLQRRKRKSFNITNTLSGAGTALGGWTGKESIDSETKLMHANREYAVLGMLTNVDVACVALQGVFSANMRVGVPGDAGDVSDKANYFCNLSRWSGLPLIPVINANDAASTYLWFLQNENAAGPKVTIIMEELGN